MAADQPWTIGRLLQWTTGYFKKHESDTPRLDAEVLLAEACGCQRIDLYTRFDQEADEAIRARFRELVRHRAAGKPVAYLVGYREFFSLPFEVTADVLIPRPETEMVVMGALDAIKEAASSDSPVEVADVGTGSGAIAVSVARHAASARVTATDVSPAALDLARRNAEKLGVADRVTFALSDLLEALPADQQFDVIASNPPYVSESEMEDVSAEVRDHEPRQALVAGPTGVEVIARLIPQAADRLRRGGSLLIEISPMIEESVIRLFAEEPRFERPAVIKDLSGHPRVVQAKRREME